MALVPRTGHDRRSAESGLRDFRLVADDSPGMIWIAGTDGQCNWFNQGWLDFTGRPLADELGNGWAQGVHPGDAEQCLADYRAYFAAREPFLLEYRLRRHDGEFRWLLDSGSPRFSPAGEFLGYSGICVDIHERKQREEAERNHTEFVNAVLDSGPECVHVISPAGELVMINRAGLAMLEADSLDQIKQCDLPKFVVEDHRQAFIALQEKVFDGARANLEFEIVGLKGTRRWLETRAAPLRDKDGTVLALIGITHDITEHHAMLLQLEYQARTDSLTKLPNRGHFLQVAERELGRAIRYGGELSMLLLDIDHFKQVNDLHGHKAGDLVLATIADICRATLRDCDVVGRIGGEEFAVLLPETDAEHAFEAAQRLRQAIAEAPTALDDGSRIQATVSIGVASLDGAATSVASLLQKADSALYAAKHAGRNCVIAHH